MLEGQSGIHTAGTRSSRGVLVEITDETGKPLEGAAVSFRLPEEGPGGTFSRGTKTEIQITGPDGRAGFREFIAGRATGPFQVRVTAARDSIRAGTIVDQYVSEAAGGKSTSPAAHHEKSLVAPGEKASSSHKWLIWLAVAGGAAAAAVAVGAMGHGSSPAAPASAAAAAVPAPVVGVPVISIGGGK